MSKTLVAYFTASSGKVTEQVAKNLAQSIGADLFEIEPKDPYTAEDIDWRNRQSRCNLEWAEKRDVPIKTSVENMEQYDLILVGFPIWYGCAPNIVNTFLKSYDLSGKKIAAFATSGGSPVGETAEKLKPYISASAEILGAKLFKASASQNELKTWADSLK